MADDQDDGFIVKLRGLPWKATVDDIINFFQECNINFKGGKDGVHMTISREGRPSGEAFIELDSLTDLQSAIRKDRESMGNRYIEVYKVSRTEMNWAIKQDANWSMNNDGCLRLRGIPFACSKEEIVQFFTGLEIVPNGIVLMTDYSGRSSGEAYVHFINKEVAEKALQKHGEKIGHRYIEIFSSSLKKVNSILGFPNPKVNFGGGFRMSPYDRTDRSRGDGGIGRGVIRPQSHGSRTFKGNFSKNLNYNMYNPYNIGDWNNGFNQSSRPATHSIHMRGLPFKASQMDIVDFFNPIIPVKIRLIQDYTGRASGEANVEFACHGDAVHAMSKDKSFMQHRYIELFLNSVPGANMSGPNGYNVNLGPRQM